MSVQVATRFLAVVGTLASPVRPPFFARAWRFVWVIKPRSRTSTTLLVQSG
ncbi:hypothetical protein [Streptomyces cellulosae]|uniref:Uncharacterized protein n=1 Tax=Streptomyces cellulosae TaxID=1968 RepID=A0ABW7YI80_STRCE